jgi:microcystin degradation protein MlrC
MTQRVFLAGLFHETHSFLSVPTDLAAFRQYVFRTGQEVVDKSRGDASPTGGFLEVADAEGWQVIPSIHMAAGPSGMVTEDAVEAFEAECYPALEKAAHAGLDGVFLVLHGAMVSERRDDVEASVLTRVRQVLDAAGAAVPVVAVLDLHGNISAPIVQNSTMLVAYRENPHTDARETSVRAAGFLSRLMAGLKVAQVHRETPWVLPPSGVGSAANPMKAVLARARQIEADVPEILNINVMAGYAYADIPACGFSLNAATTGDPARAEAALAELQGVLEAHIDDAYPAEYDLDNALALADALPPGKGPVLLIEAADNIGGGTPGDATGTLAPLLATGRRGIVAAICDPVSVAACMAAGIGAEVSLMIGARTDAHHGAPLPFTGRVKTLSDGRFRLENLHSHLASMVGANIDMGFSAVVENDQAIIALNTVKTAPMDLGHLHALGVRPEDAAFVVVKAAVSHKAAYDPITRASFYVDSPGLCTSNLRRLPYRKLSGKHLSAPGAP